MFAHAVGRTPATPPRKLTPASGRSPRTGEAANTAISARPRRDCDRQRWQPAAALPGCGPQSGRVIRLDAIANPDKASRLPARPHSGGATRRGLLAALAVAAKELGLSIGAYTLPLLRFPSDIDAFFKEPERPAPTSRDYPQYPLAVEVRLTVEDPVRMRRQMIDAAAEAAGHSWYQPTKICNVYEPLLSRWPELQTAGPNVDGLAEHLETVVAPYDWDDPVGWFYDAAQNTIVAGVPSRSAGR